MRVALYARVSTKGKRDAIREQDVETQLQDLRRYASARGWEVVAEHADVGISGAKERRPGLDSVLVLAGQRKVDVIVIASLDRWGRSLSNLVRSLETLNHQGISLVSLRENLDMSTPGGRLMFAVVGALAEYERSMTAERTLAGLRRIETQGTRSGKAVGRPRVLFDRRRARDLREAGWSWSRIGRELGIPKSTARRCVESPGPHRGERPRKAGES